MRSATVLASGPVSPIGPTHIGQPVSQSHPAISALVEASSSDCMLHSGALNPMPPGYASYKKIRGVSSLASDSQLDVTAVSPALTDRPRSRAVAHQQQLRDLLHRERQARRRRRGDRRRHTAAR